jgi:hypothetical protein
VTASQPSLGDKPSRMRPADLGSAFSAKTRSDGLGGRLAPMKLAPAPPAQSPQAPEAAASESKAAKVTTPRPVKAAAVPAARTDYASSGLQPIVVYVSASIRERLRNEAGDRTFTDIVLMALDATYAKLQTRFVEQPSPTKSMFAGRGRPTSRRHAEPHVQVSLRPLRDDLAVIDRLSAELNAPSRSALINAALDEYLPPDQ